jgi:hypothetical protein
MGSRYYSLFFFADEPDQNIKNMRANIPPRKSNPMIYLFFERNEPESCISASEGGVGVTVLLTDESA